MLQVLTLIFFQTVAPAAMKILEKWNTNLHFIMHYRGSWKLANRKSQIWDNFHMILPAIARVSFKWINRISQCSGYSHFLQLDRIQKRIQSSLLTSKAKTTKVYNLIIQDPIMAVTSVQIRMSKRTCFHSQWKIRSKVKALTVIIVRICCSVDLIIEEKV